MIKLTNKTATEIQHFLDKEIYGDELRKTDWSSSLADGLLNKKHHLLAKYISHGKGFNDSSKKAICLLLQIKPVFTQKAIDNVIAKHCGISLDKLLLERETKRALFLEKIAQETLLDTFSNGEEIVEWVKEVFNKGYTEVITQDRKSFIVNADKRGFPLPRAAIRKYAEAFIKHKETHYKLNALAA